jgi:hypothetical protein
MPKLTAALGRADGADLGDRGLSFAGARRNYLTHSLGDGERSAPGRAGSCSVGMFNTKHRALVLADHRATTVVPSPRYAVGEPVHLPPIPCRGDGDTGGDVAARGSASDLLRFLWGRGAVDQLEVFGDAAALARFRDEVTV